MRIWCRSHCKLIDWSVWNNQNNLSWIGLTGITINVSELLSVPLAFSRCELRVCVLGDGITGRYSFGDAPLTHSDAPLTICFSVKSTVTFLFPSTARWRLYKKCNWREFGLWRIQYGKYHIHFFYKEQNEIK